MDLSYRQATEQDWELVRDLEKAAGSVSPRFFLAYNTEQEIKDYLQKCKVFFVVKDNQPIGTVAYTSKGPGYVSVDGLAILPQYAGKGYGTEAMKWVLDQIKDAEKIDLVVHPHNGGAIRIYLKLGFQIEGWKDNYFGDGEPRLKLTFKTDRPSSSILT